MHDIADTQQQTTTQVAPRMRAGEIFLGETTGLEYGYHDASASGEVTEDDVLGYETVVWFTGDNSSSTFTESDQTIVSTQVWGWVSLLVTVTVQLSRRAVSSAPLPGQAS